MFYNPSGTRSVASRSSKNKKSIILPLVARRGPDLSVDLGVGPGACQKSKSHPHLSGP